jgi:hypothetical protein
MVLDRERGLPMATTHSPGRRVAEVPSRMMGRFRHGILNSIRQSQQPKCGIRITFYKGL